MTTALQLQLDRYTEGEFELILVRDEGNDSIAELYNAGARFAKGELLCLMHNDVEVGRGWNLELEEIARKGNLAFPKIIEDKGDSFLRGFPPIPDGIPPSCCVMMGRSSWDKLGGMDECFKKMHFEDMDFYRRALDEGIGLVEARTQVKHKRAGTRQYLADRGGTSLQPNKALYVERHGCMLPIFTMRRERDGKGSNFVQN